MVVAWTEKIVQVVYFYIVGSVILEVVTPLFWKRIENDYASCSLASLQDFLNKQSTIHVLFHLRHRNTWCCKDKTKCSNNRSLPLQYCQWDLLYTETNPGVNPHDCHCKFSANPVQLDDLDITLASLILLNCCTLTPDEKAAIKKLRQYKNDYLSHNIKGAITKREYRTLWADLTSFILQLDPSKQDDLTRIEARPLDEALCSRYCTSLLDLHERLDEIYSTIQTMNNSVQGSLQNMNTTVQSSLQNMGTTAQSSLQNMESSMQTIGNSVQSSLQNMGTSMQGTLRNIDTSLQELLFYARRGMACQCYAERNDNQAVNNSTVAVTLWSECIEMYDIHNKLKLKSISVPGMWCWERGITTINNKLVVGGNNRLLIIDHQTGEVVQTIHTDCTPGRLHGSGDRIFYSDNNNNNLYWYSYTDDRHHTLTLPSHPMSMTTLQDGSLYVVCKDGSVQHVSSDGKQYKPVKTKGLTSLGNGGHLYYNCKQRKLVTYNTSTINIFHEK
ncbi:unnamed protein product [Mytilus edulis]|uniref:DZIP3-like HEPN domain-containing protein n=1 Tax=Mytilus edulis TaxID=6550 RepID=A0A8S3TWW2_MYTED|nr:unnamed protein product [Mytilus edulis]